MLEGESATVEVKANPGEHIAVGASGNRGGGIASRTPLLMATVVFALTVTFGRDALYNQFGVPFGVAATAASIAGLFFFLVLLNAFAYFRRPKAAIPRAAMLEDYTLTAAPDGLHISTENMTTHHQWRGIVQLNDTDTHMFLYTAGVQTIAVPKKSFESREHASRFAIIVRSHLGAAG